MNLDFTAIVLDPAAFVQSEFLPSLYSLDPTALAIGGVMVIAILVLLVIVIKLFSWVLSLIKRFVLFLIVVASLLAFFARFQNELLAQPPDYFILAVGAIGVFFALVAFIISLVSVKREWGRTRSGSIEEIKDELREELEEELAGKIKKAARAPPPLTPTRLQQPSMFSSQALHPKNLLSALHDRSILAVLSYMVVAQFGVFSGVTISAPNETVGLVFFGFFVVAALVFIKSTYHNYLVGIRHLAIALVFGMALSIFLGNIWTSVPITELLSLAYFKSSALVALVTGLAVSLFMGSKG